MRFSERLWRWRLLNPQTKLGWLSVTEKVHSQMENLTSLIPTYVRSVPYEIISTHTRSLAVNLEGSISPCKLNVIRVEPFKPSYQTHKEFCSMITGGFDLVPCCICLSYNKNENAFSFAGSYKAMAAIRTGKIAFTPSAFKRDPAATSTAARMAMYMERGFRPTVDAPWDYSMDYKIMLEHATWAYGCIQQQGEEEDSAVET